MACFKSCHISGAAGFAASQPRVGRSPAKTARTAGTPPLSTGGLAWVSLAPVPVVAFVACHGTFCRYVDRSGFRHRRAVPHSLAGFSGCTGCIPEMWAVHFSRCFYGDIWRQYFCLYYIASKNPKTYPYSNSFFVRL